MTPGPLSSRQIIDNNRFYFGMKIDSQQEKEYLKFIREISSI